MIKSKMKQVVTVHDWDSLVMNTYGKPYSFQQQDGCKDRGIFNLTVPEEAEDFENDTLEFDSEEMGVSFAGWLAKDCMLSKQRNSCDLFWMRHFYPDVQMIANDLHAKGLMPAGEYVIDINW